MTLHHIQAPFGRNAFILFFVFTSDIAPGALGATLPLLWSSGATSGRCMITPVPHADVSAVSHPLSATLSVCDRAVPRPILAQWALLSPPPEQPLEMCDNGDSEDKPPAPPVRMSSTIFSTGSGKDSLSANHSSKPLPSVPEERKPRNKIISIFSGAEKSERTTRLPSFLIPAVHCSAVLTHLWWVYSVITSTSLFFFPQVVGRRIGTRSGRRFHRLQTLNTPYMSALTPSLGSSLWVSPVCYWSLVFWSPSASTRQTYRRLCTGHAGAMGPAAPDVKHHQVGAEEKPTGCAGRSQILRLNGQRSAEVPQLFLLWWGSEFNLLTCPQVIYCPWSSSGFFSSEQQWDQYKLM